MRSADTNAANACLTEEATNASFLATLRSIFVGWELLRPVYMVLVAGLCLALFLMSPADPDAAQFWGTCLFGGIIANICYFAGPIAEGYVAWLGWRHHLWLRPILFCLGTLFTMILAIGAHSQNLTPGFD